MLKYLEWLEKSIIFILIGIITLILVFATLDMLITIGTKIITPPYFLQAENLMELFSVFLIILIGIELLETIKAFLKENIVHVEIVVLVAIIAVARKVIIWDSSKQASSELIPYAIILLSLAITYFIIRRSNKRLIFPRLKTPGTSNNIAKVEPKMKNK